MEVLYDVLSWGSPIGISLFLFLMASGRHFHGGFPSLQNDK